MESELQMAERHVREAELLVSRQCIVIESLRAHGHSTEMAMKLLGEMEAALDAHRSYMDEILADQQSPPICR